MQQLEFGLLQIGMAENISDPDARFRRIMAIVEGDVAAHRAIIDEQDSNWDWEMHYQYAHGTAEGLTQAVDGYIAQFEEKNYPWRTECDLTHALFFQEVGKVEAYDSIMSQCRQEYEPALETGYVCYCSWLSVIDYLILTGREAQAIQKLFEWFAKGGSELRFPNLEVVGLLQNRAEYEEFLELNAANLQHKQQVYEKAKLQEP